VHLVVLDLVRMDVGRRGHPTRLCPAQARAAREHHRRRISGGRRAIADKIASLRHAQVTQTRVTDRKLRHYRLTLQLALIEGLAPVLCGNLLAAFARP
jgi:hypothetical protein